MFALISLSAILTLATSSKDNILLYKCVEKKDEKCNNSTLTTNQFELEKENVTIKDSVVNEIIAHER